MIVDKHHFLTPQGGAMCPRYSQQCMLKDSLPLYFDDITKGKIESWRKGYKYEDYNNYITNKLDELGITIKHRKRKFDHFIWFNNR